jgi:FkbM family methyltransferase
MYSQNNEEKYILDYFGDYVGTFADIGANDGITLSNTRKLMELGWSGICLEPSPKAYARLEENCKNFPKVYTYPFAISHTNREMTLNESGPLLGADDTSLVSTFFDHEMDRFKKSVKYTPVTVKCFRWKTFLNRPKIKKFDFISIDIEGGELEVLPQMDLSHTRMIIIEWNGKNKLAFTEICAGFNLIGENAENLIFAR